MALSNKQHFFLRRVLQVALAVTIVLLLLHIWNDVEEGVVEWLRHTSSAALVTSVVLTVAILSVTGVMFSSLIEADPRTLRRFLWSFSSPPPKEADKLDNLKGELIRVRAELAALGFSDIHPTQEQQRAFVDELRAALKEQASRDFLIEIRDRLVQDQTAKQVLAARHEVLRRLEVERSRIATRGNFNLFIGLVTTVVGIALLVMFANDQAATFDEYLKRTEATTTQTAITTSGTPRNLPPSQSRAPQPDIGTYLIFFLPRLSLVLLVELFAYFFLNLYKASLTEGKYLQNEITNVELRSLGLTVAIGMGEKTLSPILQSYVQTDRNQAGGGTTDTSTANDRAKVLEIVKELVAKVK